MIGSNSNRSCPGHRLSKLVTLKWGPRRPGSAPPKPSLACVLVSSPGLNICRCDRGPSCKTGGAEREIRSARGRMCRRHRGHRRRHHADGRRCTSLHVRHVECRHRSKERRHGHPHSLRSPTHWWATSMWLTCSHRLRIAASICSIQPSRPHARRPWRRSSGGRVVRSSNESSRRRRALVRRFLPLTDSDIVLVPGFGSVTGG